MMNKYILCIFSAYFCLVTRQILAQTTPSDVIVPPENKSRYIGSDVILRCEVNPDDTILLEWFEYITSPAGVKIFSSVEGLIGDPEKYAIQGTYNLIVMNVSVFDGGLYGCVTPGMPAVAYASVVVLERPLAIPPAEMHPTVTYNVECLASFGSVHPSSIEPEQMPYLEAYVGSKKLSNISQTLTEDGQNTFTLSGIFSYEATIDDFGSLLDCFVYTASPPYQDRGRADLNILFSISDMKISPIKPTYGVGEIVTCSTSGNPVPTYYWIPTISPEQDQIESNQLQMTSEMLGENTWRCEARQMLNGTENIQTQFLGPFTVENNFCGGKVMFSVSLPSDKLFVQNEKIIYTKILTNCGQNFDETASIFTCPANGYYVFFASVKSRYSYEVAGVDVVLDGSLLFRANSPNIDGASNAQGVVGSNAIVTFCAQGSQISASQPYSEGSLYDNNHGRNDNTLTGVQIA